MRKKILAVGLKYRKYSATIASKEALIEKPIEEATLKKLNAFTSRIGLNFDNKQLLLTALTHKSFNQTTQESSRFNLLGQHALKFYTTEYVIFKYPKLPAEVVDTIVEAYVGQNSLASIAKQFGVQFAMRWKLTERANAPIPPPSTRSWIMESLVGAIYSESGPMATKEFIKTHIFPRAIDVDKHLDIHVKLQKPRVLLNHLTKSLNKPKPVARLLKETGRQSSTSVFVIGIYSGFEKIGEGYGSSLQMAETRAVKDALLKHYSEEIAICTVPSDGEKEDSITFFKGPENQK